MNPFYDGTLHSENMSAIYAGVCVFVIAFVFIIDRFTRK